MATLAVLSAAGLGRVVAAEGAARLYVATDGDDTWSGRLAEPNAAHTDGPFATPARARDAVRDIAARAAPSRPMTVLVRGGTYYLPEPLGFGPTDSGRQDAPVTYAAYPGETPVFSAGRVIRGWRASASGLWVVDLPEVKAGRWSFHQLFVNNQRRRRARSPNQFYYRMEAHVFRDRQGRRLTQAAGDGFRFHEGDIRRWANLDDVQVITFFNWYTTHHWVADLDEAHRVVWLSSRSKRPFGRAAEPRQRYIVANCREALDAPGEWYLDRKTGRLTYYPMPGEDMADALVIAPVLTEVVRFEGEPEVGLFVEHLAFRGLSFQHSDWDLPRDCVADAQNHRSMASQAIFARGLRHSTFEACEIAHVGAFALWLERGCSNVRVARCHLHDLGSGGIRVGEDEPPADDAQLTEHIVIDNNFIHDSSHVFHAGVGVWISHCPNNRITRNEICDLDYTGISVGWRWDAKESQAHHNLVEGNHIHHIGRAVLSDLAGVYMLGLSPGTVVRNNVIHDVYAYSYGGWGLYGDAYCRDIVFENNLCYRTKSGGFFQNYGTNNVVRNNVFAFVKQRGQIARGSRDVEGLHLTVERNIIYNDNELVVGSRVTRSNAHFDRNLYHVPAAVEPSFTGLTWTQWQATGQDAGSVFADPQFVDVDADDYRLKPGSPAFELGFQPVDYTNVGLYGPPEWVTLPSRIQRAPIEIPPEPEPPPVADDFETDFAGSPPSRGVVRVSDSKTLVVTDETAAGGRQSLKFADAPKQKYPWHPHIFYRTALRQGTACLAFDLRLEKGALFGCEWRSNETPYQVGPSLRVEQDGSLVAGNRELTALPLGEWVHVEISYRLGDTSTGHYDLTVTPAGQPLRQFKELQAPSRPAKEVMWIGFMSLAEVETVYYLDNLALRCDP